MKYAMLVRDRKKMVARIGELTGIRPVYQMMPRCGYEIGSIEVLKDGTVVCGEDNEVIRTLIAEGWIKEESPDENGQMTLWDYPESNAAAEEEEDETMSEEPETECAVTVSLDGVEPDAVRRLIVLLRQRAGSISRATGGDFYVSESLLDMLNLEAPVKSFEDMRDFISASADEDEASLRGLEVGKTCLRFTGFPETEDTDTLTAYRQLAEKMTALAVNSKRPLAREPQTENEKFAMRVWLIRLGMSGADYKKTRKILIANLPGNSAWRTEESRIKSLEKVARAEEEEEDEFSIAN